MQVLLQRLQKGKVFSLWIKYELAKHEEELIDQYNIRKVVFVEGNPRQERVRALKMAGALAVIVGLITIPFFHQPFAAIPVGILVLAASWPLIYKNIKETIRVEDVLNGRHFTCRSIITLLNKEDELGNLAKSFAGFLENLKEWGGRAVFEIPPGRPPIAKFIGKPRAAE